MKVKVKFNSDSSAVKGSEERVVIRLPDALESIGFKHGRKGMRLSLSVGMAEEVMMGLFQLLRVELSEKGVWVKGDKGDEK